MIGSLSISLDYRDAFDRKMEFLVHPDETSSQLRKHTRLSGFGMQTKGFRFANGKSLRTETPWILSSTTNLDLVGLKADDLILEEEGQRGEATPLVIVQALSHVLLVRLGSTGRYAGYRGEKRSPQSGQDKRTNCKSSSRVLL